MSRRRYVSTEISTDSKLTKVSDFAALLYTWMIPHAADDCRLSAKNAEELLLSVIPGRNKTIFEVEEAVAELQKMSLVGRDANGQYFLPSENFYKYQTYINAAKRRETPRISEEQRESAPNTASPSPSPSPSPTRGASAPLSRAREEQFESQDFGLGERDPSVIVGADLWGKLESHWQSRGKVVSIYQRELLAAKLAELKEKGQPPRLVVEKTLRSGWMNLHELDPEEIPSDGNVVTFEDIRKRAEARLRGEG